MKLEKGPLIALALAVLLTASPAWAGSGPKKAPVAGKETGAAAEKSVDTAAPASANVKAAGADKDEAAGKPAETSAQSSLSGPFARLDTNADGAVTAEEFVAREMERFKQHDKDGDGKITAEETAPPKMTAEEKTQMEARRKEREEKMEKMRALREERMKARAGAADAGAPALTVPTEPVSGLSPESQPASEDEALPPDTTAAPTPPEAPVAPQAAPVEQPVAPTPAPAEEAPKKKKFWPW